MDDMMQSLAVDFILGDIFECNSHDDSSLVLKIDTEGPIFFNIFPFQLIAALHNFPFSEATLFQMLVSLLLVEILINQVVFDFVSLPSRTAFYYIVYF